MRTGLADRSALNEGWGGAVVLAVRCFLAVAAATSVTRRGKTTSITNIRQA
jgi:hypothetical protein